MVLNKRSSTEHEARSPSDCKNSTEINNRLKSAKTRGRKILILGGVVFVHAALVSFITVKPNENTTKNGHLMETVKQHTKKTPLCSLKHVGSLPGHYEAHDGKDNWVLDDFVANQTNNPPCILDNSSNNTPPDLVQTIPLAIQTYNQLHNITKPTFYFLGDSVARFLAVRLAQLYTNNQTLFDQARAKEACKWGSNHGSACTLESSTATVKFAWFQWAWFPAPVPEISNTRVLWNHQRTDRCDQLHKESSIINPDSVMSECLKDILQLSSTSDEPAHHESDVMLVRLGLEYILFHERRFFEGNLLGNPFNASITKNDHVPGQLVDYKTALQDGLYKLIPLLQATFHGKLVFYLLAPILSPDSHPDFQNHGQNSGRAQLHSHVDSVNNILRPILQEHNIPYIEPFANYEYLEYPRNKAKNNVGYKDPLHFYEPMLTTYSRLLLNTVIGMSTTGGEEEEQAEAANK